MGDPLAQYFLAERLERNLVMQQAVSEKIDRN